MLVALSPVPGVLVATEFRCVDSVPVLDVIEVLPAVGVPVTPSLDAVLNTGAGELSGVGAIGCLEGSRH